LLIACQRLPDDSTVHSTSVGEHKDVRMADGVELTLNTDSRVRTSVEGNSRVLDLEKGEVLLSVPVRSQ